MQAKTGQALPRNFDAALDKVQELHEPLASTMTSDRTVLSSSSSSISVTSSASTEPGEVATMCEASERVREELQAEFSDDADDRPDDGKTPSRLDVAVGASFS